MNINIKAPHRDGADKNMNSYLVRKIKELIYNSNLLDVILKINHITVPDDKVNMIMDCLLVKAFMKVQNILERRGCDEVSRICLSAAVISELMDWDWDDSHSGYGNIYGKLCGGIRNNDNEVVFKELVKFLKEYDETLELKLKCLLV